jgi:hypothetical protein
MALAGEHEGSLAAARDFALGLLDHLSHYARAEAFAGRRGHGRPAGFVPAQNKATQGGTGLSSLL